MTLRIAQLTLGFALASCLTGCSSGTSNNSGPPSNADALNEVANMIREYAASHNNRPPSKASDLAAYKNQYTIGANAIDAGDVIVLWGASVAGEGGGGSETIIAYEKSAPDSGGAVLLQNGTVKKMTAAEFNAAPKAKKK